MVRLVNIVAPTSWGAVAWKSILMLLATHLLNIMVSQVIPGLNYEVDDAIACTLFATPLFAGFLAMLKHLLRLQQELTLLASTDMLTGLPNRRSFLERAGEALEREGTGVLLLLDADHFKRINDRWGHGAGDAALVAIGRHLRAVLRPGDVLGRLGGEEFAAFLPATPLEEARRLGRSLCAPIPLEEASAGLSITLSAGAASTGRGNSLDRLMARADRSLYRAKAEGRARMHVAEEEQDRAA